MTHRTASHRLDRPAPLHLAVAVYTSILPSHPSASVSTRLCVTLANCHWSVACCRVALCRLWVLQLCVRVCAVHSDRKTGNSINRAFVRAALSIPCYSPLFVVTLKSLFTILPTVNKRVSKRARH